MEILLGIVIAAVIAFFGWRICWRKVVVFEFEKGLLYRRGKFEKLLDAGAHWLSSFNSHVTKVDTRLKTISVPGQEVLSADNVTLKVTLAAQYQISDPNLAVNKVESYEQALYMALQLALRELVGGTKIDDLIAARGEIGKKIFLMAEPKVKELGLGLKTVDLKDIMFPGDMKKIFAQVVNAQKEGLAALERARGETAALRSLANAARMLHDNPALMQLRVLQSVGEGKGNTIVLGMPSQTTPLPIKSTEADKSKNPETGSSSGEAK